MVCASLARVNAYASEALRVYVCHHAQVIAIKYKQRHSRKHMHTRARPFLHYLLSRKLLVPIYPIL